MSGVDVLSVMDRDAELALSWNGRAKPESQQAFRQSQEARAAVAELIAALETLVDSVDPESTGWDEAVYVLSRVRGAE